MTDLDVDNPTASTFSRNAVPTVEVSSEENENVSKSRCHQISMFTSSVRSLVDTTIPESRCPCDKLSLGSQWPEAHKQVPFWVSTPMWNREWTEGDIKKEECRRVYWSALTLVSGQTSFADAVNWKLQDLFILEPSNVGAILNWLTLKLGQLTPHVVFHFISGGIATPIEAADVLRYHEWQEYGLGALSSRNVVVDCVRADAAGY